MGWCQKLKLDWNQRDEVTIKPNSLFICSSSNSSSQRLSYNSLMYPLRSNVHKYKQWLCTTTVLLLLHAFLLRTVLFNGNSLARLDYPLLNTWTLHCVWACLLFSNLSRRLPTALTKFGARTWEWPSEGFFLETRMLSCYKSTVDEETVITITTIKLTPSTQSYGDEVTNGERK